MTPLSIPGIENGYKVDDMVWRGAQPSDSAWPLLGAAGCKRVIDLNSTRDQDQHQYDLVKAAGMDYVALHWNGIIPPSARQVEFAISKIAGPVAIPSFPVFVHCQHGSDRTGTLCAIWRMHHDGWDLTRAMEEAVAGLGLQGTHEAWMLAAVAEYAHDHGMLKP